MTSNGTHEFDMLTQLTYILTIYIPLGMSNHSKKTNIKAVFV